MTELEDLTALFDISRDRDCYGLTENSEISGRREVFGLRQRFDHFEALRAGTCSQQPVQYGKGSTHKSRALENHSSL